MTPEELRDLDAEVHVRVMRKTVLTDRYGRHWTDEQGPPGPIAVPRYSADIAAAWQVVEAMQKRGFTLVLEDWRDDKSNPQVWCAYFNLPDGGTSTGGVELPAPLAICRAALAAFRSLLPLT